MEKESVSAILHFLTFVGCLYVFVLPVKMLYKSRDEFTLRAFLALSVLLPASLLLGGIMAGIAALSGHEVPEKVGEPAFVAVAFFSWLGLMAFAIHRGVRHSD